MFLAPIVRNELKDDAKLSLDRIIKKEVESSDENTYLKVLKCSDYVKGTASRTLPLIKKSNEDDDYCEVIGMYYCISMVFLSLLI